MKTMHGFDVVEIRDLEAPHAGQTVKLWKVDPPIKYDKDYDEEKWGGETPFVVTSSVSGPYAQETFAFAADEDGHIVDWGELPGSMKGVGLHKAVIALINHDGLWN
jgi:hypothetical protein